MNRPNDPMLGLAIGIIVGAVLWGIAIYAFLKIIKVI